MFGNESGTDTVDMKGVQKIRCVEISQTLFRSEFTFVQHTHAVKSEMKNSHTVFDRLGCGNDVRLLRHVQIQAHHAIRVVGPELEQLACGRFLTVGTKEFLNARVEEKGTDKSQTDALSGTYDESVDFCKFLEQIFTFRDLTSLKDAP